MDTPEKQIKNDRERRVRAAMKAVAAERTTITYSDFLSEINWNVLPKSPQYGAAVQDLGSQLEERRNLAIRCRRQR